MASAKLASPPFKWGGSTMKSRAGSVVRLAFAAAVLALLPASASAQVPQFMAVAGPMTTAKEAFADSYGQLMIDELDKALRKGADPACLAEKKIAPGTLRARGEDMLVRHGQAMFDRMLALINGRAADAEFARLGGAGALAEWRTLAADPLVVELNRIMRPGKLDALVDQTTEMFDRYVVLNGFRLDNINPVATGSELMEKSRAESSSEQADAFMAGNDTAAMQRYIVLSEATGEAIQAAVAQDRMLQYGPTQWMAGLDGDLRAACVVNRQQ
jgi:hypothetical protein